MTMATIHSTLVGTDLFCINAFFLIFIEYFALKLKTNDGDYAKANFISVRLLWWYETRRKTKRWSKIPSDSVFFYSNYNEILI